MRKKTKTEEPGDAALFADGELADHPPVMLKRAFDAYNAMAVKCGWPVTVNLTESRQKRIKVALKDCGGLAGWEAALDRASKSDLLTGKVKPRWGKAPAAEVKLDWFLWDKRRTPLLDGEYDNKAPAPQATPSFRKRLEGAAGRAKPESLAFVVTETQEERMRSTVASYLRHGYPVLAARAQEKLDAYLRRRGANPIESEQVKYDTIPEI